MIAAPVPVVVRAEIDNTPQADIGFDAPHIQVFEIAASVRVGLEIYTVTATVYLAVLNIDIPHSARHFASDSDGPTCEMTVADDNEMCIRDRYVVKQPLNKLGVAEKYDIKVNLCGGGFTGQSQALRLAIARALVKINAEDKAALRAEGFMTRDPRSVERKKPGQPKARRRFQFSKR